MFVQDPNDKISQFADTSRDLGGAKPQVFTYKSDDTLKKKHGKLNFYPSSLEDVMIKDDIASKLLYGKDKKSSGSSITVQDLLDTVPGVQIREFLPDTRLD